MFVLYIRTYVMESISIGHLFIAMPTIECVQIMRIIKAIRLGWIKPHPGTHRPRVYMLWDEVDQVGDGRRESGGGREGGEGRRVVRGREGWSLM